MTRIRKRVPFDENVFLFFIYPDQNQITDQILPSNYYVSSPGSLQAVRQEFNIGFITFLLVC